MKTRINVRCYRCGFVSSRGCHDEAGKGQACPCGGVMREMPRRYFGQRTFGRRGPTK